MTTPNEPPTGPTAVDLRDYVEFDLARPLGRRVFATEVVAVDLLCLEPRQTVDARTLPTADAVYTVLGGVAWVVTDEAEVTLTALQSVMVPAGVPHGLRNDSVDPLIMQVIVSPPDEAAPAAAGPVTPSVTQQERPAARQGGVLGKVRRTLGG